ncbi:hypothetical protein FVR03_15605 [Pontibacter qinzhouensis]|uniref:Uncharacterized protein n=1 Tax=Pontibacter qinzhouensis TaxID=2603253 RepID=A0A5C8JJ25_9BACT|nr:hypothetical protein [Pontibacter qinzhouensis]TXK37331.1 hypothetical protein FVR03_15605 [Pontibacter qinzhouensis]
MKDKYLPSSYLEISVLIFVALCVVFGVTESRVNIEWFEQVYVVEDGFIEWLTVLALVAVSGSMFYRYFRLSNHKPRLFRLTLLLIGVLALFGAGEEISWGQRIFNIESTAFFNAHNSQQETNLHNMVVNGTKINKLVFSKLLMVAILLYLIAFPIAYSQSAALKNFTDKVAGVAVPKLYQVFFFLVFLGLAWLCPSGKRAELIEFSSCTMFLLIFLYPLNNLIYEEKEKRQPAFVPDLKENNTFASCRRGK